MLKPIQTFYKGYRFRSRLEARWAVFFDALAIEWKYEPEGFQLAPDVRYLPDFWLPQVRMWAEVKGANFSQEEKRKCQLLANQSGRPCLILNGDPDGRNFWACMPYSPNQENEPGWEDFVIDGGYLEERRFYQCTGEEYPEQTDNAWGDDVAAAISAARQARFEFGETPRLQIVK